MKYSLNIFYTSLILSLISISCVKKQKIHPTMPSISNEDTLKIDSKQISTFKRNLQSEPSTLHPIHSTDVSASIVQNYVLDSLLTRDLDTYQWMPHLATKWKVSKDHKSFTFTIRPNVTWHDGKPVTVEDVVFSFKVYKDPSFKGVHNMPYYENIQSADILDSQTVRFNVGKKYFNNLSVLGGLTIIPKHIYQNKKSRLSRTLIGSGPYILKQYLRGKKMILVQNPVWWGRKIKPDHYRIKKIILKFISDENDQLIRMARGDLDFLPLSPEAYNKKTSEPPWGKSLIKKEIRNKQASGYGYIGWNLTNPLFKDKKVRKALAHLMNRSFINKKFFHNKRTLASGPWYSWSDYASPQTKAILFDPQKAQTLLKQAGWKDTNKDSLLDQIIEGRRIDFRFTLIIANRDAEKYITIYQQELKKNGIDMSIRFMDWSAFLKILHEKKFSAVMLGWGAGGIEIDPKQIWHSQSAVKGGSNFISYSNQQVDQLIDRGRSEVNRNKRIKLFRKVYSLIANDYPYLFLFNTPVYFYAINKKVRLKKDTYNYGIGLQYWQIKSEAIQ